MNAFEQTCLPTLRSGWHNCCYSRNDYNQNDFLWANGKSFALGNF